MVWSFLLWKGNGKNQPFRQLATLDVHEAMGVKVDREAVATLVLPQLWTMSMGPSQCSLPRNPF
jgi:hypothetical protein